MDNNEFIEIFKELIQRDGDFHIDDRLSDIEEWDSMGMMVIIAYFDAKLNTTITFEQLTKAQTVYDVLQLVPENGV